MSGTLVDTVKVPRGAKSTQDQVTWVVSEIQTLSPLGQARAAAAAGMEDSEQGAECWGALLSTMTTG